MEPLEQLIALLSLEKLEENLFRGQSQDLGWGTVFGGQVLGQALSAAVQTVPEERQVHSLHAYFLRPGDVSRPIVYAVDRIRDGGSFTTRRVVATQKGQAIFNLAASFQKQEAGFDHQDAMPPTPPPEAVESEAERLARLREEAPERVVRMAQGQWPVELRPVDETDDLFHAQPRPPVRRVWLKARGATPGALPDTPSIHASLLAYASDYAFVSTALLPHGATILTPNLQVASLDHVMWFHRPLRLDDWLLHVIDSPSAAGARGLVRGRVFSRDGVLVASTAQEGLIRLTT